MDMIVLLISICLIFCLLDLLAEGHPVLQKQLYHIAFIVVAVLCTARYDYGRDIWNYIPYYKQLTGSLAYNMQHELTIFEIGFEWFCAKCRALNLSFWGMTAIISVLYWGAMFWLFSNIRSHQSFALLALVVLDHAVFLEQIRQCLAVALIIYAFCFYHRLNWKILPMLLLFASITVHKTALPFIAFLLLCLLFYGLRVDMKAYLLLAVLLISFAVIALHPLLKQFVPFLPSRLQDTVSYHLMVGKRVQKIFLLYFMAILCMGYYTDKKKLLSGQYTKRDRVYHWVIWCSLAVIVVLYQYYLILYRIRSYLLPFIVVWLLNELDSSAVEDRLPKQLLAVVMLLFSLSLAIELPRRYEKMKSRTDRVSWVWELAQHSEKDLEARQLKQAELFWSYDNQKGLQLGFK